MPKLSDFTSTTEVILPKSGITVQVANEMTFGDALAITDVENEYQRGLKTVTSIIRDWDVVDDNDHKCPVTEDIVKRLPASDVELIMSHASQVMTRTEKKTGTGSTA